MSASKSIIFIAVWGRLLHIKKKRFLRVKWNFPFFNLSVFPLASRHVAACIWSHSPWGTGVAHIMRTLNTTHEKQCSFDNKKYISVRMDDRIKHLIITLTGIPRRCHNVKHVFSTIWSVPNLRLALRSQITTNIKANNSHIRYNIRTSSSLNAKVTIDVQTKIWFHQHVFRACNVSSRSLALI